MFVFLKIRNASKNKIIIFKLKDPTKIDLAPTYFYPWDWICLVLIWRKNWEFSSSWLGFGVSDELRLKVYGFLIFDF